MKKNKKITLGALSLATALTLNGCEKNSTNNLKNANSFEIVLNQLENINEKEVLIEEKNEINIEEYEKEFVELEGINIYYHYATHTLFINGIKGIENYKEVSEVVYGQINSLIQEAEVNTIEFYDLANQIDFAKLNLSNVKKLDFNAFKGNFNSTKIDVSNVKALSFNNCDDSKFDFSGFSNQVKTFSFSNVSSEFAERVLTNFDINDSYLSWYEEIENSSNLKNLLEYLIENNISLDTLHLEQWNKENYNGITKSEFDLLSKLSARFLYIYADGFKEPLNLDLTLNENIQDFYIDAYNTKYDESYNRINGELGNIKIKTNNEKFYLSFSYANITSNTHFSLPDSAWISLEQLNCTDISAFKDLRNVSYLWFKEDIGPGLEADLRGEIRYCKNKEYFPQVESCYRDYEDVLKDIEYFYKLSKLNEKLNVSPYEKNRYYYIESIGDYVNLVSNDVRGYKTIQDLKNQKNDVSSYYGTSEIRRIKTICMGNEDNEVKVDNMEDYEFYINEGYVVIGYELVNPYSLNNDGTLTTELYCEEDAIQLIYTPFNSRR